jgi:hypothetical protein
MAIHIHIHTGDAWEEEKHPRRKDGKFGAGAGGVAKTPKAASSKQALLPSDHKATAPQIKRALAKLKPSPDEDADYNSPLRRVPDEIPARAREYEDEEYEEEDEDEPYRISQEMVEEFLIPNLKGKYRKLGVEIDPATVFCWQSELWKTPLEIYMKNPNEDTGGGTTRRPVVTKLHGIPVVQDGNHRVVAALLSGRKIKVDYYDLDKAKKDGVEW